MNEKRNEKIFLTVGSEEQKMLAQRLISSPHMKNCRDVIVVSDADFSFRLGSGGALLKIISENYNKGDKVVVINSGGYAKRSINYALRGKAFTRFVYKKEEIFLLEAIILSAQKVMDCVEAGVFVLCGDILVDTEGLKIKNNRNSIFACSSDIETGTRHGVMFCDKDLRLDIFAHKKSAEALKGLCKKYNTEGVLIDTGAVFLNEETVCKILQAEKEKSILKTLEAQSEELSLYNDIVPALANSNDEKNIFDEILSDEKADVLISKSDFIHFGTLKECVDNIIKFSDNETEKAVINSSLNNTKVKRKTLVENSILSSCTVEENSIVSDVNLSEKDIPSQTSVCGFKLKNGKYVSVVTDINENPKLEVDGKELWYKPRFFEAKSFDESYEKFMSSKDGDLSLADVLENADFSFYFDNAQYISDMLLSTGLDLYSEMRKAVTDEFFKNNKMHSALTAKKDFSEINLPVRVNL